jgi:8-oxo-dGTP pyrophosphatase MutT (NUDIX family)
MDLTPRYESVAAILLVGSRYVLQHRDDRPDIAEPGRWSLFGGSVSPGEPPRRAIERELFEELHLRVGTLAERWRVRHYSAFRGAMARFIVFDADVTREWERHRLGEGQRAGLFDVAGLPADTVPLARALLERHAARRHGAAPSPRNRRDPAVPRRPLE